MTGVQTCALPISDQGGTAIDSIQRIAGAQAELADIEATILATQIENPNATASHEYLGAGPAEPPQPGERALKKALTLLRPEFAEAETQRRYPRPVAPQPDARLSSGELVGSKVWAANIHSSAATFSDADKEERFTEKRDFADALRWISVQDRVINGGAASGDRRAVAERVNYTDHIIGRWEQATGQTFARPQVWTHLDGH